MAGGEPVIIPVLCNIETFLFKCYFRVVHSEEITGFLETLLLIRGLFNSEFSIKNKLVTDATLQIIAINR